jgi:two-component system, cell cycle sensor histidine kinase and response regulator CckA
MSAAIEFAAATKKPHPDLRLLLENAPFPVAQIGEQGEICALNAAMGKLLENRPKSIRPALFGDLVAPEEQVQADHLLCELFSGKRNSTQLEAVPATAKEGPRRWNAWRVSSSGSPNLVVAMTVDTPANQQNQRRLRQAEQLEAIGRLAGGIAHDFNNLLTGVLLYSDLLLASLDRGQRAWKFAEEIRNAGIQASGLVRQLLTLSRPTNPEPRLFSLNEIAEGMRTLLVRLIGENIELQLDLDPNLGLVHMDPAQAQQILLNLILNARDAMPGGGKISIETRGGKLEMIGDKPLFRGETSFPCGVLIVSDNGTGMTAATREHLFEPFFSTKAPGKGTGLGLTTVHDIVNRNGGLIHVDSTPGCGTRITVILPASSDSPAHRHEDDFLPERNLGELPVTHEE